MLRAALGAAGSVVQYSFLPFLRKNDATDSSSTASVFLIDEEGYKRVLAIFEKEYVMAAASDTPAAHLLIVCLFRARFSVNAEELNQNGFK